MTKFIKQRNVTLPLAKIKEGIEYVVTMLTAMALGKLMPPKNVTDPVTGETKQVQEAPATVAQIKALQDGPGIKDGEEYQMLCNTIFAKELREQYPNDSYVGKSFAFTVFKIDGKRYKGCAIAEVTLNSDHAETPAAATETPDAAASTPADASTETAASTPADASTETAAPAPAPSKGKSK